MSANESTRSGESTASSCASAPPIDIPAMCAAAMS
jgi:hypothetical protein